MVDGGIIVNNANDVLVEQSPSAGHTAPALAVSNGNNVTFATVENCVFHDNGNYALKLDSTPTGGTASSGIPSGPRLLPAGTNRSYRVIMNP